MTINSRVSGIIGDYYGINTVARSANPAEQAKVAADYILERTRRNKYDAVFACAARATNVSKKVAQKYTDAVRYVAAELAPAGEVIIAEPNGNPVYQNKHTIDSLLFVPNHETVKKSEFTRNNDKALEAISYYEEGTHCCGVKIHLLMKSSSKDNLQTWLESRYSIHNWDKDTCGCSNFVVVAKNTARMKHFAELVASKGYGTLEYVKSAISKTAVGLLTPDNHFTFETLKKEYAEEQEALKAKKNAAAKQRRIAVPARAAGGNDLIMIEDWF